MKLGSLFDGIGGFPLVASRHGITPVWASEIVPACMSITKRHFPGMKHLGDITKINGAAIEPVDIITFGSPCQDLSVAGKRAGLAGERSGLFGEAVRIIDEMRLKTNGEFPTWAIWENVPGALSSNGGLDFRAVLQAFAACEVPVPKSGRWAGAGMVRGGRCDIAWRIMDAQFFGVPQRRRRIFLVADFRGRRAGEVLFKPESLRRNFAQGRAAREETAGGVRNGVEETNYMLRMRAGCAGGGKGALISTNRSLTLKGQNDQVLIYCPETSRTLKSKGNLDHREDGDTLLCVATGQSNAEICENISPTLNCACEQPYIVAGFCHKASAGAGTVGYQEEISPTLKAGQGCAVFACRTDQVGSNGLGISEGIGYTLDGSNGQAVVSVDCRNLSGTEELSGILQAKNNGGYSLNYINPVLRNQIIRRLTPTECERLMGFPDHWTSQEHDGKPISDAARYRALGNSVALPCVDYVLGGIAEALSCATE